MTAATQGPAAATTYARALRRRWKLIVAVVALTLVGALIVLAVQQPPARPVTTERVRPAWTATTTLMRSPDLEVDLQTVATLATIGEIPDRVATDLGVDKDELVSALTVDVGGDATTSGGSGGRSAEGATTSQAPASGQRTGTSAGGTTSRATTSDFLTVTAAGASADAAESAADAVGAALIEWTVEDATAAYEERSEKLVAEIDRLRIELEEMEAAAAAADDTGAEPEQGPAGRGDNAGGSQRASSAAAVAYDVKLQEYGRLLAEHEEAADAPDIRPGLEVIEPAAAVRVPPPPAADALLPSGRRARLAGAGILGVLGAVALALVLDRLDGRLYTTSDVRRHVRHPVVGAVGRLSRRERRTGELRDRSAEAFRMLAAKLLTRWRAGAGNGPNARRTVMVVGARTGAGTTTITRNLAVELTDLGVRVLVFECDMRASTSRSVGDAVEAERGLADVLQGPPGNGSRVIDAIEYEQLRGDLRVLRAGQAAGNRAALLGSDRMARALSEASDGAEIVLLDAPPLLEVTDAAPLVRRVDLVLVALRAGRTTAADAADVVELLDALGAHDVAVVVSGAEDASDLELPWRHDGPRRRGGNPRLVRQTVDA